MQRNTEQQYMDLSALVNTLNEKKREQFNTNAARIIMLTDANSESFKLSDIKNIPAADALALLDEFIELVVASFDKNDSKISEWIIRFKQTCEGSIKNYQKDFEASLKEFVDSCESGYFEGNLRSNESFGSLPNLSIFKKNQTSKDKPITTPLNEGQCNKLTEEYESLIKPNLDELGLEEDFLTTSLKIDMKKTKEAYEALQDNKKTVIDFCRQYGLELYNIAQIPAKEEAFLLELNSMFLNKQMPTETVFLGFVQRFNKALEAKKDEAKELHGNHYKDVLAEFKATNKIDPERLLTDVDMDDLLNYDAENNTLQRSPIINFDCPGDNALELTNYLINNNVDENLFIPFITQEGHYVSLVRIKEQWSLRESRAACSMIIINKARKFLKLEQDPEKLAVIASGKQKDHYSCGTHVVNDYRTLGLNGYQELSHKEMLEQALKIQQKCPEENVSSLLSRYNP